MGLTLDRVHVLKAIADFIAEVSMISDVPEKIFKIDVYIDRLQDEMNKIEAFRRELPLCLLLLGDGIAAMKEERRKWKKLYTDPVLEEFIPLKKFTKGGKSEDAEKMNWMRSVQLWSSDDDDHHHLDTDSIKKREEESMNQPMMNMMNDDLFSVSRNRAIGITFDSVKAFANLPRDESPVVAATLTLRTPEIKNLKNEIFLKSSSTRSGLSSDQSDFKSFKQQQQQALRKQRRCWSPELHRQFVNALHHLGGAQAATPKQIRELMHVDGLTNDEVKSHLQKYRLHKRRINLSTLQPGSFWKCGESSKTSNSQSGSPLGPLHLLRGASSEDDDEEDDRSENQSHLLMRIAA